MLMRSDGPSCRGRGGWDDRILLVVGLLSMPATSTANVPDVVCELLWKYWNRQQYLWQMIGDVMRHSDTHKD